MVCVLLKSITVSIFFKFCYVKAVQILSNLIFPFTDVPLDGRRMKIDVIGAPVQITKPQVVRVQKPAPKKVQKKPSPVKKQQNNKKQVGKKPVGKAKNSPSPKKKVLLKKGGKKPAPKKEPKKISEEDLDKQLDAYLAAGSL